MKSVTETMRIDQIQHAGDTQIRVQLDLYAVDDYARAMQEGDVFPPVDVFFDGETYWLADGFHRLDATKRLERNTIAATIHQGSKRDAILFAIDTNRRYGVRLSNKDKQRMVKLFLTDEVWTEWSDREIARRCGVSHQTVVNHRESICQKLTDSKPTHRKANRNGKAYTIDTANIGKPSPVEPEPPQETLFVDEAEPVEEEVFQEYEVVAPVAIENTDPPEPEPVAPKPISKINIFNRDAQYLSQLVNEPVHLVITSPPYNVGIDYSYQPDDLLTYLPMLTAVWKECYKVMADGARIAVNVPFGVGRNPWTPMACKVMQTLVDADFTLRGQIIWDKNTTGNRTSWGSFRLPSDPSLRDTTEVIIVAHKGGSGLEIPDDAKGRDAKGSYSPWLVDSDYFMELAQDHWIVAPESSQRIGHPAPFPVELVKRLMHFYAFPGAHILDPFAGSGTVGVTAKMLGCDATLFEIDGEYCELMERRINGD